MLLYFKGIRPWSKTILGNDGNVSRTMKQREPLMGFELTPDLLLVRRCNQYATTPLVNTNVLSPRKPTLQPNIRFG